MESIRIEILNPEVRAILESLEDLKLIEIKDSDEEILKAKLISRAEKSEKDIASGAVYSLDDARKEAKRRIRL